MILFRRQRKRIQSRLVTLDEFARFIRKGNYAKIRHMHNQFPWPDENGGDAILRRINYDKRPRHEPVANVTWVEAHAFCIFNKYSLPKKADLISGRVVPSILSMEIEAGNVTEEWCLGNLDRGEREKPVYDGKSTRLCRLGWSAPCLGFRIVDYN